MALANNDGIPPLKPAAGRIAVIGPNADAADARLDDYYATPSEPVTVLAGLRARSPQRRISFGARAGRAAC